MESYFEFNVAYEGKHLFATAPRSFPSSLEGKAKQFFAELCERFPESEGFSVSVTEWKCYGHPVTLSWLKCFDAGESED